MLATEDAKTWEEMEVSLQTGEMIRILKKQFRRQNAVGDMLVWKLSFAPIEAKIQLFKSYCYRIYGCALWLHSFQNSIRKLTVSYSDTFKHLINIPSLGFAMSGICDECDELDSSYVMN